MLPELLSGIIPGRVLCVTSIEYLSCRKPALCTSCLRFLLWWVTLFNNSPYKERCVRDVYISFAERVKYNNYQLIWDNRLLLLLFLDMLYYVLLERYEFYVHPALRNSLRCCATTPFLHRIRTHETTTPTLYTVSYVNYVISYPVSHAEYLF
jgi:hypothetical protein